MLAQAMCVEEATLLLARIEGEELRKKAALIVVAPEQSDDDASDESDPLDAELELRRKAAPSDETVVAAF